MSLFRRRRQPYSLGEVDVISGRLMVVDPAWLPEGLAFDLTHAVEPYTMGRAIIVSVGNDGGYQIFRNPNGTLTIDTDGTPTVDD